MGVAGSSDVMKPIFSGKFHSVQEGEANGVGAAGSAVGDVLASVRAALRDSMRRSRPDDRFVTGGGAPSIFNGSLHSPPPTQPGRGSVVANFWCPALKNKK